MLGASAITWVGGRTVASAAAAVGILQLGHTMGWGLRGVWAGVGQILDQGQCSKEHRTLQLMLPVVSSTPGMTWTPRMQGLIHNEVSAFAGAQ